jgi:hypothetical protein
VDGKGGSDGRRYIQTGEFEMQPTTVRELIAKLEKLPVDAPVVLASDEEGNDFGLLAQVETDANGNVILWPASGTVDF